jgi:hypothetical protein
MAFDLRSGQWLKFKLAPQQTANMLALGAFQTPDGFFLGIYVKQRRHIMLQDERGHNVATVVKDAATGVTNLANVYFTPESVLDLCPLDDVAHLPPGAVIADGWEPEEARAKRRLAQAAATQPSVN